eukprot:TRINITY_DN1393_c0_g1_i4.p1 TRINITY_DN1393_c0_g1~~TRINITY_DN1393_c0_g1_i4.p1  ORF type:complete len:242 (-),score=65.48 TRINITY_DN1393_c0_g1_i4:299-1024(-)
MTPIYLVLLFSSSSFLVSGYVLDIEFSDSMIINVDDSPVLVELYYESFCPGCRNFLTTMLYPAFDKLRDSGIMKAAIYPYGNAHESKNPDGTWKFECQHGEPECVGNILEVCIMQQLNWDVNMYLPVISCMEAADDPVSSAKGCLSALSSVSYDAVKKCASGKEGNKLEHAMGAKTEALSPPHKYVPWIVINGEHTDELQNEAQTNLVALVCKLYKGESPAECSNLETGGQNAVDTELDWA